MPPPRFIHRPSTSECLSTLTPFPSTFTRLTLAAMVRWPKLASLRAARMSEDSTVSHPALLIVADSAVRTRSATNNTMRTELNTETPLAELASLTNFSGTSNRLYDGGPAGRLRYADVVAEHRHFTKVCRVSADLRRQLGQPPAPWEVYRYKSFVPSFRFLRFALVRVGPTQRDWAIICLMVRIWWLPQARR